MRAPVRLGGLALVLLVGMVPGLASPADAARHHGSHTASHAASHATSHAASRESHALGLPAPVRGAAGRHAWGGWIGAWRTSDGEIVYHLDPGARRGRARYGPATDADALTYHRKPVPTANQRRAAWILSRYGAVLQRSQDAATELAIDDLLLGGSYGLDGQITRTRLLRLDASTRADVLRLAGQMLANATQQIGPYELHVAKSGVSSATSMPLAVTVTSASGHPLAGAQVGLAGAASSTTGPHGEPASLVVPRPSAAQQLVVTAMVPDTVLHVRAPRQHRLSRAAVAGVRTSVSTTATISPPSAWTLTSERYVQTAPASDTRTWQTLYSGTFQDSWTCTIPKGASTCQDPAGDPCSHNVALNSGTWTDYPSVPADGYRSAGNTCVWRDYTATSSRVVQTGGTFTPAQYGWTATSSTYADAGQAAAALTACQADTQSQRACSLSDNGSASG